MTEERLIGGMDTDTDGKFLSENAIRENTFNNRTFRGDGESGGGSENVLGNTLIPNNQLPSGENIVIGSAEDKKNRRVVYMVANSNADHCIFQYDSVYNDVELLVQSSLLNFSPDHPITGIDIIDGKYCMWTDANNQPCSLDLEKASNIRKKVKFRVYFYRRRDKIDVSSADNPRFSDGDSFILALPGGSPYTYTINTGSNALRNDYSGFCRVWANAINSSTLVTNGIITGATAMGKYVEIEMATEGYPSNAVLGGTSYGVLVYENAYELPFIEDYFRRIRRPPTKSISITQFYDRGGVPTTVTGYTKGGLFPWQFQVNHGFYDNTESVFSATSECPGMAEYAEEVYSTWDASLEDLPAPILNLQDASDYDFTNSQHLCLLSKLRVNTRQSDTNNFQRCFELDREDFVGDSSVQSYVFTGEEMLLPVDVEQTIRPFDAVPIVSGTQRYIKTRLFDGDVTEGYNPISIDLRIAESGIVYVPGWLATDNYGGLHKKGQNVQYGIKYFDDYQRETTVLTDESMRFRIPFPGEVGSNSSDVPELPIKLYSDAPSWAKYWQLVRTNDLEVDSFIQSAIEEIDYLDKDENPIVGATPWTTGVYVKMKLTTAIENEYFGSKQILPTENVRVRFITINQGFPPRYIDLEIIRYDSGYYYFANPSTTLGIASLAAAGGTSSSDLVEVYSLKEQSDEDNLIFYECGKRYEVFQSGSRFLHRAEVDQTTTTPAELSNVPTIFWYRDYNIYQKAYRENGYTGTFGNIYAASTWMLPLSYNTNNIGRPSISDYSVRRQRIPSMIRYTDPYVENTETNGLSVNKGLNYFIMPNNYGAIKSLMNDNEVLVSIHNNSNSSSAYIDEAALRGSRGQEIVALSDEVINQERPYKGSYGTQHSRGVSQSNRGLLFYLDSTMSSVVQRSANGLDPISLYNMNNYWRRRTSLMREANDVEVLSVFDRAFDEVLFNTKVGYRMDVTNSTNAGGNYNFLITTNSLIYLDKFNAGDTIEIKFKTQSGGKDVYYYGTGVVVSKSLPNIITLNNINGNILSWLSQPNRVMELSISSAETIAYSPSNNAWTTKYSFNPEDVCELTDTFVSFINGQIYLHNSNVVRNNFYGVQYDRQIEVEFGSSLPQTSKDWLALEIQQEGMELSVPTIETSENQESELENGNFENIEGVSYSSFLRDKNTAGVTNAVLYGNFLKGHTIRLTLKDTSTSKSLITILRAMFNPSNRTIK